MASANGLRHPASASCLGRHLRLAGRCPNNSSLFPPLAAVVVVALWPYSAEKLFYNFGIPERLRTLRYSVFTGGVVKATGICSACFLRKRRRCGESFCLSQACRDAPLGQRQGGVFRLPPPYLWTPPTPQRAKGCTPLTILKKKSKHKKASAAPVGAIALTLFSLLHL